MLKFHALTRKLMEEEEIGQQLFKVKVPGTNLNP